MVHARHLTLLAGDRQIWQVLPFCLLALFRPVPFCWDLWMGCEARLLVGEEAAGVQGATMAGQLVINISILTTLLPRKERIKTINWDWRSPPFQGPTR